MIEEKELKVICFMCDRSLPTKFINNMFIVDSYYKTCCRCALKLRNLIHGIDQGTPFRGEIANQLWVELDTYLNKYEKGNRMKEDQD